MIGRIRTFSSNRISGFFQPHDFLYYAGLLGFFPSLITISVTWLQGKFNFFSRFTSLPSVHHQILPVRLERCASTETLLPLLRSGELSSATPEGNVRYLRRKESVVLGLWLGKGTSRQTSWILNAVRLISLPYRNAKMLNTHKIYSA